MTRVAYGHGAYKRSDLPEIRVVNQFVEASPANPGDNAVLLPRPALKESMMVGSGPIRGLLSQPGIFSGDIFAVSGDELYREGALLGDVVGADRVSLAATTNKVMIANDVGLQLYDGATLANIAFPDGAGVAAVGYIAGYSYAVRTGTRRIYFTLDPATWDGLDYFSAEQDTGNIVGVAIVSDQLWVFCERVTEVFGTTGDSTTPFQRIEGRLYDKGCLSRDTIVKGDNTVFWTGNDRIVYRADSTPVRISNHGIEERLAHSQPDDLSAWLFIWNGHTFYVLRTAEGTFCQDAATKEWCEFASYGRPVWRAHVGVFRAGSSIAGDDTTGQLWTFDETALTEGGTVIERIFTVLLPKSGIYLDNIAIEASAGDSPSYGVRPLIEMRKSRNRGKTWLPWRPADLGARGDYDARPVWRRCGIVDRLTVLEFRMTDPSPYFVSAVRANEPLSGRSR